MGVGFAGYAAQSNHLTEPPLNAKMRECVT
jgi:hypothetical protein